MANIVDDNMQVNISVTTVHGLQDFSSYTELDPENNIARTTNQVSWTLANRNIAASVYYDYPAGTFGDFTHTMKTLCSARSNRYAAIAGVWALSNGSHTLQQIINNGGFSLFWYGDDSRPNFLRLSQYGPTLGISSVALNLNVEYSLTITRSGSNLTCVIRDPSGAIVDTLSLTGVVTTAWSSIITYHSYNNAGSSATTTGYDKDLTL